MNKEDLHTFDAKFISFLKDGGYKFIRLINNEGSVIVLWNNHTATTMDKRITEIKKRLLLLPDGIYILEAKFGSASTMVPDRYYIKKGKVDLSENIPTKNTTENKIIQMSSDKGITTVESALQRIEEISTLKAENSFLKNEVARLQAEVLSLNAELDADESLEEGEDKSSASSWLKDLGTLVPSLADEFFKTKNRELDLKEAALKVDYLKARGGRAPQVRKNPRVVNNQIDISNEAQMNALFEHLENLTDEQFEAELKRIEQVQPELISIIVDEFQLNDNLNEEQKIEENEE